MVFHWSLSDSKSPQVSRTLLSILAVLNNAVVWMVSTRPEYNGFEFRVFLFIDRLLYQDSGTKSALLYTQSSRKRKWILPYLMVGIRVSYFIFYGDKDYAKFNLI